MDGFVCLGFILTGFKWIERQLVLFLKPQCYMPGFPSLETPPPGLYVFLSLCFEQGTGKRHHALRKAPNPVWVAFLPIDPRHIYSVLLRALLATLSKHAMCFGLKKYQSHAQTTKHDLCRTTSTDIARNPHKQSPQHAMNVSHSCLTSLFYVSIALLNTL
jgi:hypothetical protein